MADRLKDHEIETLIRRSAAMAPLAPERVRQVLESHRLLLDDRRQLGELLGRLGPAWAELRTVLNELAKVSDGSPSTPA